MPSAYVTMGVQEALHQQAHSLSTRPRLIHVRSGYKFETMLTGSNWQTISEAALDDAKKADGPDEQHSFSQSPRSNR